MDLDVPAHVPFEGPASCLSSRWNTKVVIVMGMVKTWDSREKTVQREEMGEQRCEW